MTTENFENNGYSEIEKTGKIAIKEDAPNQSVPIDQAKKKKAPKTKGYSMEAKERVKNVRGKSGLNQNEFAERVGCTFELISSIERGIKNLTLNIAINIAKEFDVSLDFLYGLENEKKVSSIEEAERMIKISSCENNSNDPNSPNEDFHISINGCFLMYSERISDLYKTKLSNSNTKWMLKKFDEIIEGMKKECRDAILNNKYRLINLTARFLSEYEKDFYENMKNNDETTSLQRNLRRH